MDTLGAGVYAISVARFHGATTGILPLKKINETLAVYPNPATDFVRITAPAANGTLTVYDASGKIVSGIQAMDITTKLPVSELPAGTYFIKWNHENNHASGKFLKR